MKHIPSIVFFSMSYYCHWARGVRNREYFVHQEISRQLRIPMITIDLLPFSFLSFLRSCFFRYTLERQLTVESRHFLCTLFKVSHGEFLIVAPIVYIRKRYFIQVLKNFLKRAHATHAWSWSYNPLSILFLDVSLFQASVFEAVDDWRCHAIHRRFKKLIERNYRIIAKSATAVFAVSPYLEQLFINKLHSKAAHLSPNGVYVNNSFKPHEMPPTALPKRVIYLGNIESRFDFDLVRDVAERMPTIDFYFIGTVWRSYRKLVLKKLFLPNVHFVGSMPYLDAQRILPDFNAGIVPHLATAFTKSNDPLKFYDYLSAGLPVISTLPPHEEELRSFVTVAVTPELFTRALEEAIFRDTADSRNLRIKCVKRYSWHTRVTEMLATLLVKSHDERK